MLRILFHPTAPFRYLYQESEEFSVYKSVHNVTQIFFNWQVEVSPKATRTKLGGLFENIYLIIRNLNARVHILVSYSFCIETSLVPE